MRALDPGLRPERGHRRVRRHAEVRASSTRRRSRARRCRTPRRSAALFLTTEALVAEKPEKEQAAPAACRAAGTWTSRSDVPRHVGGPGFGPGPFSCVPGTLSCAGPPFAPDRGRGCHQAIEPRRRPRRTEGWSPSLHEAGPRDRPGAPLPMCEPAGRGGARTSSRRAGEDGRIPLDGCGRHQARAPARRPP